MSNTKFKYSIHYGRGGITLCKGAREIGSFLSYLVEERPEGELVSVQVVKNPKGKLK